jgi:hypothetical protein
VRSVRRGIRAVRFLERAFAERMPSIPSMFPIPRVQSAFSEDGTPTDVEGIGRRFGRFASELEWYASALKAQRENGVPY